MTNIIGIRLEDKNKWERRVPLTPAQVQAIHSQHKTQFIVQPSPIRVFADSAYGEAGATVQADLSPATIILAVKEIPIELIEPNKTYIFFSHTIKGQPYNMPLLQRLLALNCQLIDYERIVDDQNRRLILFGRHAGLAGMLDTLHVLGRRLAQAGMNTPLADIKLTYQYSDLATAQAAVREAGQRIAGEGFPERLLPVVIGIAGYGNVSKGAQEILDLLPIETISPQQLLTLAGSDEVKRNIVYKVVFKEADTVEPVESDHSFDLAEFFQHPGRYRSKFEQYLPRLTTLVNCIYWDTPYPRLLTRDAARQLFSDSGAAPHLQVIGDISCDIEGGIEITRKATTPDSPAFVWNPETDSTVDGVRGNGLVVMAVDNLPCELPKESSTAFGNGLLPFIPALASCDFSQDFDNCGLPAELKRGTIVYHGQLTPQYQYLKKFVAG
jgi:saccharopine dehydrogenase (NAD+, L-lysine-forming)